MLAVHPQTGDVWVVVGKAWRKVANLHTSKYWAPANVTATPTEALATGHLYVNPNTGLMSWQTVGTQVTYNDKPWEYCEG